MNKDDVDYTLIKLSKKEIERYEKGIVNLLEDIEKYKKRKFRNFIKGLKKDKVIEKYYLFTKYIIGDYRILRRNSNRGFFNEGHPKHNGSLFHKNEVIIREAKPNHTKKYNILLIS